MLKKYILLASILLVDISLFAQQQLTEFTADTIEKHLREIEITEKKTTNNLSAFKVLNISDNLSLGNLTTASALQQIPSLSSDIEGDIRLRGSYKVNLLFEGIPLTLFEENRGDLLIQMPVELFSSILTYNMLPISSITDGEAGAVDLIFSPSFAAPSTCKFTVATGNNNRYNASLLFGSKSGKFKWQAGYGFRQEYRHRTYNQITSSSTSTSDMNAIVSAWPRTHIGMLNAQYLLSPSDFIAFNGLFQTMNYNRLGEINLLTTSSSGATLANIIRERNNSEKQTGLSDGLQWRHNWKEQKADLEVVVNYDNFDYNQGNYFANKKPSTNTILAQERLFIEQKKHQWFSSAKFSKTFSENLFFQLGYIGQWHNDKYTASDDNLTNSVWVKNRSKSTDYSINKNLHLAFVEANYKADALHYSLGLQMQFEERTGEKSQDSAKAIQNHLYLLPHFEIIYQKYPFSSWSLRYQARINRPLLSDLNPFIDNSDATYIHQGNPTLQNELVHSVELSNTTRLRNITLNPVLFYRYRYNQIIDFASITNGMTVWNKENTNHSQDAGLELNIQWKPTPFLIVDASSTGYHYEIDGTRQGYGMKGKYSADAKGNVTVKLPFGLIWNINGDYIDRQLTVQGEIAALGSVGSSLSYNCLKKHLHLSLSIDNIFNSVEEKTTFSTMGIQEVIYRNRDARAIWLSASYQL